MTTTFFKHLAILVLAALLPGCAQTYVAPLNSTLSSNPDAGSYIIVGLAEANYKFGMAAATNSISMTLASANGAVDITRQGCTNMAGFYGSAPCDLSKVDYRVLAVRPGDWRPTVVLETLKQILADKRLVDTLPVYRPVTVKPGEVVYIGDFTFATDYEAQEIRLASHNRNDDGARVALGKYPAMFNAPIRYADPVQKP